MANTANFSLYKPNRADNVEVDTSLATNFETIDTELQNNKGGLAAHISNPNAHTSENISHADGSVKTILDNHEERLGAVDDLETRVDDIETLGLDVLAPNLEGRISTIESDVEGILAPATFEAMNQQSYTFDEYRIGYVDNKLAKHYSVVKLIGNELADDTAAIQAAIDKDSAVGAWTIIPKGNYKVTAPIILKEGTRLILHKDARLARYHNDNIFQNGVTGDVSGYGNITVMGGKLDLRGHILNGASQDGSGFALGYAKNIWVRDTEIYNVYYSHGMELCALDNVFVERCGFYGFILDTGGTRVAAEAIQIERGTTAGFPYFGANDNTISKNIRIHYCQFGASANATSWNVAIGSHGDTVLSADTIEIIGCTTTNPLLNFACQLKGYTNVLVKANKFQSAKAFLIYGDGTNATRIIFKENQLIVSNDGAVYLNGVNGFRSDDNVYDGNVAGIQLVGASKNIRFGEGDVVYGRTSDGVVGYESVSKVIVNGMNIKTAGRHAFNFYDGSNHIKILNTMIDDTTTAAFNLQGANTKVIQIRGNHILDTTLTNVLAASSGADRVYFNDNFYPASIATPINSAATNSDTTGNRTF